jgi:hypothetical protein
MKYKVTMQGKGRVHEGRNKRKAESFYQWACQQKNVNVSFWVDGEITKEHLPNQKEPASWN